MSRVTRRAVVDRQLLDAVLEPRRDVVIERDAGDGRFDAALGPVRSYSRTVEATPRADGRYDVEQVVDFALALPFFGWLFLPLVRAHLGRIGAEHRLPWWAPPQPLDRRAAECLGAVMAVLVVVQYASYLLTQTMTYAADDFGVGTGAQGVGLAFVRLDIFIALPLVALADRRGRRALLVGSAIGAAALSGLSALTPSLPWLIAAQVPVHGLTTVASVVAAIVLAEEMPAGSRAWSVGILAVPLAAGSGLAIGLLFLADVASWRLLYVVAIAGAPLVVRLARSLPESRRFVAAHPDTTVAGHGRRLWLLAAGSALLALFTIPASQFQNEFLKDERGFSAGKITLFIVVTNVFGAIGIVMGGRLADTRGRRIVGATAVAGMTITMLAMFSSRGWPLWVWSGVSTVLSAAMIPAITVYGPELFPTSLRGKANGIIVAVARIGSVVGLLVAGALADDGGSLAGSLAWLAIGPLVLAVLIAVAFPETAKLELEDINPEDRLPGV